MLEINDEAIEHLTNLLIQGNSESAIRIAVMGGGQGPGLGLIVDEANNSDVSIHQKGIPFIIDRNLLEYCKTISIGFRIGNSGSCGGSSGSGFLITPENPI